MKITPDWLTAEATQTVMRLVLDAGHQIYAVGGCVRNALLGQPVADIDLSSDATPDVISALAKNAGFRVIPTGIEHGTVTVLVNGTSFEITTFRRDVETDGRRAVVSFSDRLEDDAMRRDFTMNALYLSAEGEITDPTGGLSDLADRRLRFIGDATERLREDYLRILRFFRFHAFYAAPGFDAEDLAAIAACREGLDLLSAERVGAEMMKLLSAPDPAPALATMSQIFVLQTLLPGADTSSVAPLIHLENGVAPYPVRRLAVLGEIEIDRLRLSKADATRHLAIRSAALEGEGAATLAYRLGTSVARDAMLVRAALMGTTLPDGLETKLAAGATAVFPIRAADLMPAFDGPALGVELKRLESLWIASDFTASREDLLGDSAGPSDPV